MKKTVSLILALALMCLSIFTMTSCDGLNQNSDALNAQIADLTNQIKEANSKIADLEAEKISQSAEITTLKADIKVLEAQKATLEANKQTLEAEKALLVAEIARLEALIDGDLSDLVAENDDLKAQIQVLELKVAELESAKAGLEASLSDLAAEKAALSARITELEASISAKDTEIANLRYDLSTWESQKATLIAEKNALTEEVTGLRSEVNDLRNCLSGIHTKTTATDKKDGTHGYSCGVCGAQVVESHNYVNDICTVCGGMNHGHGEYEYVYFGEYPQSVKAADVTITDTTDDRGYYLGSDGYYYAKVTAYPNGMYKFSNGETITNQGVYYFKVEPIRWRVLSEENGEYFLLCDSIIERQAYQSSYYSVGSFYYTDANGAPEGTYANNYEYSGIRAWLNGTFLESAFSVDEQAKILSTVVDNSVESTGYADNPFACNDTVDKIFLPSYKEVTSVGYGFSSNRDSDVARYMTISDYLRAKGEYMSTSSSTYGNGYWCLRSPYYNYFDYAHRVSGDGSIDYHYVYYTRGVVPALRIRL